MTAKNRQRLVDQAASALDDWKATPSRSSWKRWGDACDELAEAINPAKPDRRAAIKLAVNRTGGAK